MSSRHEELKSRAQQCKQAARVAMELAETAKTDEQRAEHLRVAVEWLKLTTEIQEIMQYVGESVG